MLMPVDTAKMCSCFPSAYERVRDSSEIRNDREHARQYLKTKCSSLLTLLIEKGFHYECPARGCRSILSQGWTGHNTVIRTLIRLYYGVDALNNR